MVKRYFENYGFDIVAALHKISLSNENKWERAMIIRSLERGNLQPVLLASGKAWIMANPRFKTIDIHQDSTPVKPKKETDDVEQIFHNNISRRKRVRVK